MTELYKPAHLRQIANVVDQLIEPARRMVPELQWSIDQQTGRPVSRWTIPGEPESPG
jgi:hypothetical protein